MSALDRFFTHIFPATEEEGHLRIMPPPPPTADDLIMVDLPPPPHVEESDDDDEEEEESEDDDEEESEDDSSSSSEDDSSGTSTDDEEEFNERDTWAQGMRMNNIEEGVVCMYIPDKPPQIACRVDSRFYKFYHRVQPFLESETSYLTPCNGALLRRLRRHFKRNYHRIREEEVKKEISRKQRKREAKNQALRQFINASTLPHRPLDEDQLSTSSSVMTKDSNVNDPYAHVERFESDTHVIEPQHRQPLLSIGPRQRFTSTPIAETMEQLLPFNEDKKKEEQESDYYVVPMFPVIHLYVWCSSINDVECGLVLPALLSLTRQDNVSDTQLGKAVRHLLEKNTQRIDQQTTAMGLRRAIENNAQKICTHINKEIEQSRKNGETAGITKQVYEWVQHTMKMQKQLATLDGVLEWEIN